MRSRLFWYPLVAAATFFITILAAGNRSAVTMFIVPFEKEFGWSAATISVAIAIGIALFGIMGPFAAALMNRFGVRRTVCTALVLLALSSLLSIRMTASWQLIVLWGFVSGVGTGGVGLALGATIANRWFEQRRGLVMGLFSAANATGQLIFLPIFAHVIAWDGWRPCALLIGLLCLIAAPLFALVVRDRPRDVGLPKFGNMVLEPVAGHGGNPFTGALGTLRVCLRSRDFWLLGGSFAICGASTNGLIGTHLVPACGDHGIAATTAAGLLCAMGVFDLIGTTASGWLSDRFDSRWLLCIYYGLRGISLLFLPAAFGAGVLGLPAFAVFYGLDWIATVPPTLKLANASFGVERGAVTFAWIFCMHQVGASVAAYGAGATRTALGTYDPAFIISGGLCIAAALLVLLIGRKPRPVAAVATA
jgi:sugar phosphate permease